VRTQAGASLRRRPALFVDRDDTLVYDADDKRDPASARLVPRAGRALRWLRDAGVPVFVVTNQSGIALGLQTEADLQASNARLAELLRREGALLDAIYVCPHHPERGPACDCRKPEPGLLLRAAREHDLDLGASLMVGDAARDLEAGRRAGTQAAGFVAPGNPLRLPAGTRFYRRWTSLVRDYLRSLYAGVPFEAVSASTASPEALAPAAGAAAAPAAAGRTPAAVPEDAAPRASAEAGPAAEGADSYSLRMKTASS
jgi:histidinol-phosphate phosphatase family protein